MRKSLAAHSVRIVQGSWLALAVLSAVKIAVMEGSAWSTKHVICRVDASCSGGKIDPAAVRTLSHYGISLETFTLVKAISMLAFLVLCFGLGALIIWRKADDRGAILAAVLLIALPLALSLSNALYVFGALALFGLLFPDGRFAPRWTMWLAVAIAAVFAVALYSVWPTLLLFLALIVPVPYLQIYRFRFRASEDLRRQMKWALFGLATAISGLLATLLSIVFAPWAAGNGTVYNGLTSATLVPLFISAIPISLAISVLGSKLWDIDRVISRALAYTTLSLVLAGLYIGGVIGFQRLFQIFAGHSSTIAIALSTLIIAALFGPLRHRIQATIDRRFYRAKYDGTRAVAAFAHRLRDEVDLAQLSQDMTAVVRETLQPEHVSLWLSHVGDTYGLSEDEHTIRSEGGRT